MATSLQVDHHRDMVGGLGPAAGLSDRGRRLDHIWVTPELAPAVADARILREARGWTQASDHVPVMIDLN